MSAYDTDESTLPNPEREALMGEIRELIIELRKIHKKNSHVLEQALKTVNYTINLLSPDEGKVYKHPQKKADNISLHLLDRRV